MVEGFFGFLDRVVEMLADLWNFLTTTQYIADNVFLKVIISLVKVLNPLNWGSFTDSESFMNLINVFNPLEFIAGTGLSMTFIALLIHFINPIS